MLCDQMESLEERKLIFQKVLVLNTIWMQSVVPLRIPCKQQLTTLSLSVFGWIA